MSALQGKQIVITRPLIQAEEMVRVIESYGAEAYLFPVIETKRVEELSALDKALRHLDEYDWILFTSVNAVFYFFQRVQELDLSLAIYPILKEKHVLAVGPKTARALTQKGIQAPYIPTKYKQEDVVDLLKLESQPRVKVLYPKAQWTRPLLSEQLQALGMLVEEVVLYETVPVQEGKDILLAKLKQAELDVLTFTSSSAVTYFVQLFPEIDWPVDLPHIVIACIGPITAQTAKEAGMLVTVEADEYTVEGLLMKLDDYYRELV